MDHLAPTAVRSINNAIQIAAGTDFACAVRGSGAVQCWGSNTTGQLGRGMGGGMANYTPASVAGL
jgi:alpha-tubulin suppressor-like RCC1 family protein